MNCGVYRSRLVDVARGGHPEPHLAAHLDACLACADFLSAQRRVSVAVREIAVQGRAAKLPRGLESELLAEFEVVRKAAPQPRLYWLSAGALALAAGLMAVVVQLRSPGRPATQPPSVVAKVAMPSALPTTLESSVPAAPGLRPVTVPPRPIRPVRAAAARPVDQEEQPFVSIPYTMPLGPEERGNVVRMDVPVSALIAAGLPMRVWDMSANASADVLVGEDGRARAVRLVSVSDSNFNRSYK